MASAYAARQFKQQDLADVDLIIQVRRQSTEDERPPKRTRRSAAAAAAAAAAPTSSMEQLACFPGHRVILFSSEYFEAQGRHWQPQPASSSSLVPAGRPTLHLTIDSAEQLPAAEAAIAAIYGVEDALNNLEQQQLIDVVVIADMLHATTATQQAVAALRAGAQSEQGLSAAALEELAGFPAWPACLLQLLPVIVQHAPCCKLQAGADLAAITAADSNRRVQRLLVAALGDLEAVWADPQLKALLLGLPLPAMQLLLSSDQLCVAAEDTMMYTAQQCVWKQPDATAEAAVKAALAQLVRAPHLSQFALKWIALSEKHSDWLLSEYSSQLRSLLSLRLAAKQLDDSGKSIKKESLKRLASPEEVTAELVSRDDDIPASWLLGPRQIRLLAGGVRLEWRLPVEQLAQACRDSFAQQKQVTECSPESSPPLGGLAWQMLVSAKQEEGGTVVALFTGPKDMPSSTYYAVKASLGWEGFEWLGPSEFLEADTVGATEALRVPPMAAGGGWDEAAWAAAGLPTSGEMLLWLHVRSVG